MAPYFGEISVIKTAAPIAIGVATKADKIVTINDPKIIGRAPNDPELGSHLLPKRNVIGLTPSTKKVDNPFWATKIKIIATMKTISTKQKNVMPFPNFSRREFFEGVVNCFSRS